jgi:hypothetical protein
VTLSSTTVKKQYDGDDSTTEFPTTFEFFLNSHVTVIHTDSDGTDTTWVEGTQYTLTGVDLAAGGTVTTKTGFTVATGEKLTIKSTVPETQLTDLIAGGNFSSVSVEDALDLITRLVQQHSEEFSRTIQFGDTSTWEGEDVDFPDPVASQVIGWNSDADGLTNYALTSIGDTLDTLFSGQAAGDYIRALSASQWENRSREETQGDLGIVLMSQVFGG